MKKQSSAARTVRPAAAPQRLAAVARAAWSTPLESLETRQHMDATAIQQTPFSLDFNSDVNDSVKDKNGKGTGFTRVQDNNNHDAYQPTKIDLDTASGTLKITTVGSSLYGSSGGTDNAQTNALETQFDGNQKGFSIETRLIGPLSNLNDRYEQAGIFIGPDQDNYVKLVAMRNWNGQYLCFEDEYSNANGNGVYTTRLGTNAQTGIGSFAAINTLDLRIVGDAAAGTLTAYWRINSDSGAYGKVGFTITVPTDKKAAFFNSASRAGILAAHKNDVGPITATFDSFAINSGTPVLTQPAVTAIAGVVSGATNIRRDPTITATIGFVPGGATSIKSSTLTSSNVRLLNADTQTTVAASITAGSGGTTIVVTPAGLLDPATTYTLQITSGVTDTNGVAMKAYSVTFTTTADSTLPNLTISKPTFYFSDVSGNGVTSGQQKVRLTNTGNAALVISAGGLTIGGANASDFQLVGAPTAAYTIKAGGYLDVAIVMKATAVGLRFATLNIASNDSNATSTTVALRGLGTAGEGGNLEPSLQRIFDLYQLGLNTGDATPDTSTDFPATVTGPDEVMIQRLKKAGAGNVTVELLGNFANSVSPSSIFGWYTAGSPQGRTKLFQVDKAYAQTVTPVANGKTSFDPGSIDFALYGEFPAFAGRVVTSEKQFNTWDTNTARQQKVRFWPLKDASGNVVPNAYVFAFEEYGVEFDQNDLIGIIRNVQPALSGAELGIQNTDGVPFSDRLVMSRIRDKQEANSDGYIVNTFHDASTLRLTNSGDQPLVVTNVTLTNSDFTIVSGGGSFTLAPGATRDITVKFVYDRTGLGNEIRTAQLKIESNDADEATKTVTLSGLWQSHSEAAPGYGSQEPTADTILKAFGYKINVGTQNTHGAISRAGEEILSEYWYAADASIPVGVRMLAAFHQQKTVSASHIRWVPDISQTGNVLYKHYASDGQTLLPRSQNGSGPAFASFSPTTKFAWRVDSDLSVDSRNTTASDPAAFPTVDGGHAMRFYAAKDAAGNIIPNTYIMLMDYVGQSFSNYDYQDNIFLITGVKPASGPLAPANLASASTADGNKLTWTANPEGNLAGYNVYRSNSSGGYDKLNGDVLTATNYVDATAAEGVTYTYRVVAVDYHGTESTMPASVTGTRGADTVAPAAPSSATANGTTSGIALSWLDNAEPDLAGYNVYRANALNGTYVKLNATLLSSSDYADLNAPAGATSYYRITAVDVAGNESVAATTYAFRAANGAVPAAPTSLAASVTTMSVTLTWTDNATDEVGFLIDRQNADGSFSQIGTAGANATSFTDGGLTSGASYVYRVRAQNSFGPSAFSNLVTATTVLAAPNAPTGLAAVALTANAVRLSWTDNSTTEAGFKIERRLGTSGAWTTLDTVAANLVGYVDGSAVSGTTYNYRVTATNNAGGATSNVAAATTPSAAAYTSVDIGSPIAAGATTVVTEGKDYDVKAGGTDVWGTSDQFRYVYRQVTGDFDYSARITDIAQADVGSMVGLMARESLNADSKHVYMRVRPNAAGGMRANYRDATGGQSGSAGNVAYTNGSAFVRLQRVGNTFNAYSSTDGTTWSLVLSRTMSMSSTVYLGIAASARTTGSATMTAKVRELTDRNASTAPAAPTDLVGTGNTTATSVTLYWSDKSTNETGFRVERRLESSSTWGIVATLGANATTYVDGTVAEGTYVYRVFATNAAGDSAASAELSVTVVNTAPQPPAAPSAVAASNVGGGVSVTWTDNASNETSFTVERSISGSGTWTTLSSTVAANATSYTDATAAAGTTYAYRVRAVGAGGNSAYATEATVTTPAAALLTSVDIATTGGSTTVATEGSAYTIVGGGADIYGTSDQFRFAYKAVTGNFDVRVRVSSLTYQVAGTMAGLMARASLDANAAHVYVKARADGTTNYAYRGTAGGTTTATSSVASPFPDAWLRLTRVGNTFTTYSSTDGVTWTALGTVTQTMPTTIYVGLAVSAHQAGTTTTASLDNLTFA